MARKIPAYKQLLAPGQVPIAPVISPEIEAQLAEQRRQEELDRKDAITRPMAKVLTTMEIRSRIAHLMDRKNYDPIAKLINIACDPSVPLETRIRIHQELAQYVAPKLRATDLQVSGDLSISINVVKFSDGNSGTAAPNRESIPVRATEIAS